MKKFFTASAICAFALAATTITGAQTAAPQTTPVAGQINGTATAQTRVVGEVTAVNAAGGEVTVKTDEGRLVVAATDSKTLIARIPPGETKAENAAKIALAEVAVGDRVFVRGQVAADGTSVVARQLVVTGRSTSQQAAGRDEWTRRGLVGRIAALNPATKEITLNTRGREGAQSVTLDASGAVKILRYAPDSVNAKDAVPASFAELRVGDQLRARGERSADGARFTPEEIITGSFLRVAGTVTSVNASANEIAIRNEADGTPLTVSIGQRTTLRRISAEAAATLMERRGTRREAGAANNNATTGTANNERGNGRRRPDSELTEEERRARREARERRGAAGGGGMGGGGGRNFQEMLESLPLITLADLKKGDAVMVVGTPGTGDASRATAINLLTGDAEFMKRLQRLQGGRGRDGQNMSPGLPGDVLGGGNTNTTERQQP